MASTVFTDFVTPVPAAWLNDANAATYGAFGIGQSWQNVSASRAYATTYTNSTARPIMLASAASLPTGATMTITVGAVPTAFIQGTSATATYSCLYTIVPAAATYIITTTGTVTPGVWAELR
jgi:hypothetical protein